MIPRLLKLWYRASGTDAQPVPPAPPPVRADWTFAQAERYQEQIRRQLQYVDTELAALRRVVETPYEGSAPNGER
jgi:hypothetical protein